MITGIHITSPSSVDYIKGVKTISWDLIGTDDANDRYNVDYSSDGTVWHTLTNPSLSPGSTSYEWDTDSMNGGYKVRVQHYNNGLKNQDIVTDITIDNTKPTASISNVSSSWTNSDSITLNCDDNKECSTIKYYYFNADGVCSSNSAAYVNSVEGSYLVVSLTHNDYLCLGVKDLAGNFDYTETGSLLYIDIIDPTASLTVSPIGLTNSGTITYTPTCSDTGGSELSSCTTYVKFNDESPISTSTGQTESTYTMKDDGTYTFYTVAIDNAGNSFTDSSYEVERDQTAPVVGITNGETTIWNVGSSVAVEIGCSDKNSCAEIKYYYSDTTLTCSDITYENFVAESSATKPYVCAAAKDNVGNIGYSSVAQFKISATIQSTITAATDGDTINVAAGTYPETLNLGEKSLTINGAGVGSTIIDAHSSSDYAIQNIGNSSTFRGLTLIGSQNYGFKVSGVNNITLENIKVENSKKTGIDLNGVNIAVLTNIEVTGTTNGFGLMILDSNDVTVNSITTSGNAWGGVSVQTEGYYHIGGSNNVQFLGTFNVGESMPLLLEQDPHRTTRIYSDITNVQIPNKFNYVVYGLRSPGTEDYKQWFYQETLENAKSLAQTLMNGWTYENMVIYNITKDNYYVEPGMKIQDAITAATDGDTINVAAGTYDEQLVIGKNLTIQGAGDTTIIKPSSASKLVQYLDISWAGGTKEVAGIIMADGVGSVTVKNLKVDGGDITTIPLGANWVTGILYRETGGTIDSVNVTDMTVGTTGTAVRGYGFVLYSATNPVSVEVKNSRISNYDKNGINVQGGKLTANIHNNIITGRGPLPGGDEVQNGILVIDNAAGTIDYNTVSNNAYAPAEWGATGIAFINAGGSATGNTLTDNQMGAAAQTLPGFGSGASWTVSFIGNTVSALGISGVPGISGLNSATYVGGTTMNVIMNTNQLIGGVGDGISIGDLEGLGAAGTVTATITNNEIFSWQDGIHIIGSIISGNNINYNKIYGNSQYGVNNKVSTVTINAENNWWGTPSVISSMFSTNVDFTPWAYNSNVDLDHVAPTSTINSPAASSWQKADFSVSLTDSDTGGAGVGVCKWRVRSSSDGGTWTVTNNKGPRDCSTPVTIAVGPSRYCKNEGLNTCKIEIWAIDNSGNDNSVNDGDSGMITRTFSIDFTTPTGTISINNGDLYTHLTSSTLTLTSGDNLDVAPECRFSNDGSTWSSWEICTPSKSWTLISGDGTKTVYYEIKDDAGNVGSDSETIFLDTTAPVITHTQTVTKRVVGETTGITATITDTNGIASKTLYYNDGTEHPLTMTNGEGNLYSATIPASTSKGTLTYYITASDNAGNPQTSPTYTIIVHDLIWDLSSEWNLVSVPKDLVDSLVPTNEMWSYDGTNWIEPTTIDAGVGYWIKNNPETKVGWNYAGDCSGELCLPSGKINTDALNPGWNLIGLTSTSPIEVSNAFASKIYPKCHLQVMDVISYDGSNFEDLIGGGDDTMNPGEGYWVYLLNDAEMVCG